MIKTHVYRIYFAMLLLLAGSLAITTGAHAASCTSNCFTVYSLSLSDQGTSLRASVQVVDEFGSSGATKSATVEGLWTRPDGTTFVQYATIGTRLRADFGFGTGGAPGTYTFEVIDVRKSGYSFDPTGGVELVSSITVVNTYNQSPTAIINSDQVSGEAPVTISFDALSSSDPDGYISAYLWNFGDGTTSYDPTPSHTYTASGRYTVTLDVLDDLGARGSSSIVIDVTEPVATGAQGCQSQCLSVGNINMSMKRGQVIGKVQVVDENGVSVADVTVDSTWSLPDGSLVTQTRQSGSRKAASFSLPAAQPGTYTLSITGMGKADYQYDPGSNRSDSGDYLVP